MATDVKKIINDYVSSFNSHDLNKALSFWTDDSIYENLAQGIVTHNKKELSAWFDLSFFNTPDLKFEVKSVFGGDEWVGIEWVMSGTHTHSSNPAIPATGKTFSVRGASIYQLRNGKIVRETGYWNYVTVMQQLGLMPSQMK
jgi:steroid delta-isomerase-like uncharacterized protein